MTCSHLHAVLAQVCYYRDKQSINKFKLATVTSAGVKITEPFALETKWDYKVSRHRVLENRNEPSAFCSMAVC